MTDTATHIADAMAKVEAIRQELVEAGANPGRMNLATGVYSVLVDMQGADDGPDPGSVDMVDLLNGITEKLAGGREALAMYEITDALWDALENALTPLVLHLNFVEAYGE